MDSTSASARADQTTRLAICSGVIQHLPVRSRHSRAHPPVRFSPSPARKGDTECPQSSSCPEAFPAMIWLPVWLSCPLAYHFPSRVLIWEIRNYQHSHSLDIRFYG